MFEERVCSTQTLLELCRAADKFEFNRRVDVEKLNKVIDPNGLHVLSCEPPMGMPYHRASMGPSREPIWPDHHRCYVYCKTMSSDDPAQFYLDVEASKYENMMTGEQAKALLDDPVANALAKALAAEYGDL